MRSMHCALGSITWTAGTYGYVNAGTPGTYKALIKGLIRPSKGLIRPLKGLIRPLKGLIRHFRALYKALKGLIDPTRPYNAYIRRYQGALAQSHARHYM